MQKYNDYIFNVKKGTNPIMLSGLTDTGKIHMAYSTRFYTEKPICIITYNELQAKKIIKDLAFFGETVRMFPKRDIVSFDYIAESKDTLYKRISVLNNIVKKHSVEGRHFVKKCSPLFIFYIKIDTFYLKVS